MIKNIIFDFGDVFINLDKEAVNRFFRSINLNKLPENMLATAFKYETGEITTDKFLHRFADRFYSALSGNSLQEKKNEFVIIWNSMLLDFPIHRLIFLKELAKSKKYRLFLLSNTNELHINWIQNDWGIERYNEFKNCFEEFYLSHEINLRKPNKDIFDFVLKENNLNAKETLFIDDTKENTDTAELMGMKVWNINPENEDVSQLLNKDFYR